MTNQNIMTLRIPARLKSKIAKMAEKEGVSMNHLASHILTQGISSMEHADIIERYRSRGSDAEAKAKFDAVWEKLKSRPPLPESEIPEWDRWPEGMEPPDF